MLIKIKNIIIGIFLVLVLPVILLIREENGSVRNKLSRLPLFAFLISERNEIIERARMTTLNHAIPPSRYLARILEAKVPFNHEIIAGYNGYLDYYEKVIEYFPQDADAYAMMGFCYYHLGEFQNAISWYQKAVYLNPQFFWNYYNLGVLYFYKGQYARAIKIFKKAQGLNLQGSIKTVYLSKIYQQILNAYGDTYDVEKELKKGYYKCSVLMALGYAYLSGQKGSLEVQKIFQKIGGNVQVF